MEEGENDPVDQFRGLHSLVGSCCGRGRAERRTFQVGISILMECGCGDDGGAGATPGFGAQRGYPSQRAWVWGRSRAQLRQFVRSEGLFSIRGLIIVPSLCRSHLGPFFSLQRTDSLHSLSPQLRPWGMVSGKGEKKPRPGRAGRVTTSEPWQGEGLPLRAHSA